MYSSTLPRIGDSDNVLLGKILERLGGLATVSSSDNNLLFRILAQLNSATQAAADARYVLKSGDTMTGALTVMGQMTATIADANNTTQPTALELYHQLTTGVGGSNIGTTIDFRVDGSVATHVQVGKIVVNAANPGSPFVQGLMQFFISSSGTVTKMLEVNPSGVDLPTGSNGTYSVAGTRVVGTRKTGWTAATGTATRTTFATGTVTLPVLAEHVKALLDDLTTHGLIGT